MENRPHRLSPKEKILYAAAPATLLLSCLLALAAVKASTETQTWHFDPTGQPTDDWKPDISPQGIHWSSVYRISQPQTGLSLMIHRLWNTQQPISQGIFDVYLYRNGQIITGVELTATSDPNAQAGSVPHVLSLLFKPQP